MFIKLLISLILCISVSLNNAVKVTNICKKNHWIHDGVWINSFYKLEYNRTFDKLEDYIIADTIDFNSYFTDPADVKEMTSLRKKYNNKIEELYCDLYINDPNKFKNIETDSDKLLYYFQISSRFFEKNKLKKDDFEKKINNKIKKGFYFGLSLFYLQAERFDQTTDTRAEVKKLINSIDVESGQSMVLRYVRINEIYKDYSILSLNKFILHKFSNYLDTYGTLVQDIILPFDIGYFDEGKDCVTKDKLTEFYRNQK